MSKTSANYAEELAGENISANAGVGLATLDTDDVKPAAAACTGPRCEKCAAPLNSGVVTICRNCGWYASLGTFVEVDANWETALDEPAITAVPKSHLCVWLDLLPRWGWVIIASVFAVVVESVVVRFATPADSSLRTIWSLSQLATGVFAAAGCHIFNFLSLAAEDADVGLLDLLLKPLKLWSRTFHNLPRRLQLVNATACGLTAAAMSLVVIGGIPYERLWDWGIEAPPQQNLMGAVMDRVKELDSQEGSGNLEDSIKDFAGENGVTGDEILKKEPPKPQVKVDCVILGYKLDRDGRLASLLLGTAHRTRLVFAARIEPKLPAEEMDALVTQLKAIPAKRPLITMKFDGAIWVQPKLMCRVSCAEQLKDGRLREPKIDKMLGSMDSASK
jgi:hypothetical protein